MGITSNTRKVQFKRCSEMFMITYENKEQFKACLKIVAQVLLTIRHRRSLNK
jgi:hypothetical protein